MRGIRFFLVLVVSGLTAHGQTARFENRSGVLYFGIGTHKIFYSRSDLHLVGNGDPAFDFTMKKVRAKDDFFLKKTGGAPQYDYKMGYYFRKKNFGIEFNFDHVKYFVKHDQVVRTAGEVDGQQIDEDLPVTEFVQNFEHSDGANYALFNFVKWKNLSPAKPGSRTGFQWEMKAGIGPVIPKTNSTIMGNHWDDHYKLAGYVVALETGLRCNFLDNFFIEPSFKGAYADYRHFLITDGHGNQRWFSAQFILAVGAQFGM